MKLFLTTLLTALGVLGIATSSGWAQAGTKRIETPIRTPVVRNPSPIAGAPVLAPLNQALPLTQLSASAVQVQSRPFNLDTALARLLADLKAVTATGEFELSITNADKVEVTTLPLVLHLMEGRVRTELDLRSVPTRVDPPGPFTMLRGAGITRIVTL